MSGLIRCRAANTSTDSVSAAAAAAGAATPCDVATVATRVNATPAAVTRRSFRCCRTRITALRQQSIDIRRTSLAGRHEVVKQAATPFHAAPDADRVVAGRVVADARSTTTRSGALPDFLEVPALPRAAVGGGVHSDAVTDASVQRTPFAVRRVVQVVAHGVPGLPGGAVAVDRAHAVR